MKKNTIDIIKLLKKYKKGWVALSKDYKKVVVHSETFDGIVQALNKKKEKDLFLLPVAKHYSGFITVLS